ncbi:MAG: hypothetical protein ACFFA5_04070 [Promethearchaeota archaeon]
MKENESNIGEINLKKQLYENVCRPLCRFYKEGQEDDPEEKECGAWEIIKEKVVDGSIIISELRDLTNRIRPLVDMTGETKPPFTSIDQSLVDKICKPLCEFYADDQEHWEKDYQCGAYKLLKTLISSEKFRVEDLK